MGIPAFYIPRTLPEELHSLLVSAGIQVTEVQLPNYSDCPGLILVCTSADGRASVHIEFSECGEHLACCIAGGPSWFDGGAYRELFGRIEEVLRAHGGVAVGEEER